MNTATTIPAGYWQDAQGNLVPASKVKPIDKDRHKTVLALCEQAERQSEMLANFKTVAMDEVEAFIERSLAEYDVKAGGKKGNVTLVTFDGRYKIVRQMQESIAFDERLQAAKGLIDECVRDWSKGSNANIRALVNNAFQVDKEGLISTSRVLGLRSIAIADEKWKRAMDAISDSVRVTSTKAYIRFYKRAGDGEGYLPINLDVAAL
jgi:hypothetical protein